MSAKKLVPILVIIIVALIVSIPTVFSDVATIKRKLGFSGNAENIGNILNSNTVLGEFNGQKVKVADLMTQEMQTLFDAQNSLYNAVENIVANKYILFKMNEFMQANNIQDRGLAQQMFLKQRIAVSDAEVDDFIEKNKDNPQLKGKSHDEQVQMVRPFLVQQAEGAFVRKMVDDAKAADVLHVTALPKPERPRKEIELGTSPVTGADNAAVTIIEFADYQCFYCAKATSVLDEILEKYPGQVKVAFRHLPLPFHPQAHPAALVAVCAQEQGKFWPVHKALFANQSSLSEEVFLSIAKENGLDLAKLEACRKDPQTAKRVQDDASYASALGVNATPAFFINGIQTMGALPFAEFKKIIDQELANKK